MKRILVIADRAGDAQPALEKGLSLARLTSADVHVVVSCYEELDWLDSGQEEGSEHAREQILGHERRWWRDYLVSQGTDLQVSHEVIWQKYPLEWILDHCQQHHYDLLIRRGHRSESVFYTPTDWSLLRDSRVPVYLVSEQHLEETRSVLTALDLMARNPEKQRLNERLLEAAFRLAVATNSDLHCCYVIRIPELVRDMDLIDVAAHTRSVEQQARQQFEQLFDCYDLDNAHVHIRSGVPWKVIASLSAELKVNCIVIGTRGRKGLAGKFFGNTSERVIHVARKDLLVIGQE